VPSTGYRLVEIFSAKQPDDQRGSAGTGYLLGAGLVLTARHVLVPEEWNGTPPNLTIFARALAQGPGALLEQADLIWPNDPRDLEDRTRPDVALIRLRSTPSDAAAKVLVGRSRQEREDEPEILVHAGGFPGFADMNKNNKRDTVQLTGRVEPLSGARGGLYEIKELNADKARLDWHGISGAGLLAERALIGVVITQLRGNALSDFRAQRLEPLLRQFEDFRIAVAPGAELDLEITGTNAPPPKLAEHLWLVDREDHEADFRDAFKQCCPKSSLICVIPGHPDHLPEELLSRFRQRTLPDLGWSYGGEFNYFEWPGKKTGTEVAMGRLRERLWRFLSTKEDVPREPAKFREKLSTPGAPRLFYSEMANLNNGLPAPAVLREWLSFWAQLTTDDACPPIHVLLAPETPQDEMLALVQSLLTPELKSPGVLQDLQPCTRLHLRNWVTRSLPEQLGMGSGDRLFTSLWDALGVRFSDPFPLKSLQTALKEVTHV